MRTSSVRGALLAAAMLTMLAVAATPAHARLTPVNGTISAISRNTELRGAIALRCPTAEFTGTINATGTAISGRLVFSRSLSGPVVTCTTLGGAVSFTITCVGGITLRATASDIRTRTASVTVVLDNGFNCKITTSNGCIYDIRGPQNPNGGGTYTDGTQTLTLNLTGISIDRSAGGVLCPAGTTRATLTGDYRISAGGPVLVS